MNEYSEIDNSEIVDLEYTDLNELSLAGWLNYHYKNVLFEQVEWMGIPTWKNVLDLWIYQELLFKVRPDIVVEMGSYKGGSTLYLANLLDIIGRGRIVSVDIDHSNFAVSHARITTKTGSTQDQEVIDHIRSVCKDARVMIIHDADHRENMVLKDLSTYADLVSKDSYFIVEDGVVDLFSRQSVIGGCLGEPGPLSAIREFLENDRRFVVDTDCEKYLLTYNPRGYLKKIADKQPKNGDHVVPMHKRKRSAEPGMVVPRTKGEFRYIRNTYLELMHSLLVGTAYRDASLLPFGTEIHDDHLREHGLDWPAQALTMIGVKRMVNLRELVELVLAENIPGDFIETGVWRGGACIMMRALLQAHNITDRRVWVADSFAGLPPANEDLYPADAGSDFHEYDELAVSLEEVQNNFRTYDLLDDQVKFLKGWFKDTLPSAEIDQLSLLRLDGDMYESTMDALTVLYPKLSPGGYVIIDDFHIVPACKKAVEDYCQDNGIEPEIIEIDGSGVYWQKPGAGSKVRAGSSHASLSEQFSDLQISYLYRSVIKLSQNAMARLNQLITGRDQIIVELKQASPEHKASVEHEHQVSKLNREIAARDARIAELERLVVDRNRQIGEILSSTSWSISSPFRFLKKMFQKGSS
ncbi:MAG: class I SAM-dependent methyltransferase [Desulfuromusa sp.]|nr:class I SAM-dependent methyltransferase [Desulfuromusa sp.]